VSKLFGIPVGGLATVLAVVLAVALAAVAVLAVRNPVFLRLGIRNVRRRRARTALIVVGLMLGTTIIAAALATGDTMSRTIRSSAVTALGRTDEVVAAKGLESALTFNTPGTSGARYFPQQYAARVRRATARSGLVAGVEPVIVEDVAVQDATTRQNEPRVSLFASDPKQMRGFGEIRSGGRAVSLAGLGSGEVYLNDAAGDDLGAQPGDAIRILAGRRPVRFRVKAIVSYDGAGTDGDAVLMPLPPAQALLGQPGRVRGIFIANSGGPSQSAAVVRLVRPVVSPLGLEVDNTKQDALDAADEAGAAFMSFFTTFGSFSIAAGILLIFLIFVMLAAERRGELGIARAVGTRRGHLVQMFVYEGAAYDLLAAAVGALVGMAVAYGMVLAIARAFGALGDFHIAYSVSGTSMVLAYALGVLLTLVVVAVSAWRVSRMNVSSAIRNLPEPPHAKARRWRWILGAAGVALGLLLAVVGVGNEDSVTLGFGVSLLVLGLVPILRALGVSERASHTGAGLALVIWFVFPISRWLFGEMKVNFGIFVLGGLMIVVGATWTIMYNADVLLGTFGSLACRIRSIAPVVRMAMAYPLRGLFRTGVTVAMFTLVVFTLVVGATTTGSFTNAINDTDSFGGGFDVRATSSPAAPIGNLGAAIAHAPGLKRSDIRLVSSESVLPVKARQLGAGAGEASYLVNGADDVFLSHNTYRLAMRANGYTSDAEVWRALRRHPGLAVVDPLVVPRKANWNFGGATDFRLHGFYLEDKTFAPIRVSVRDEQSNRTLTLKVVGVLSDTAPPMMMGLWTSQRTLAPAFGDRVLPTVHLLGLRPGVDPRATAKKLESAFLGNGMEADALEKLLSDQVSGSLTFDRLMMGFMALGLIVGVAALGVITARAVVERRQQIGVLRAIGFSRRTVQLCFVLESSFVALTSIVVGTGLGLAVAYSVISDSRRTPSWENMSFAVPWTTLAAIFVAVYVVTILTTLAPALRASRVYPAEALRYQ
jgi:putative ABC transport system permease protein